MRTFGGSTTNTREEWPTSVQQQEQKTASELPILLPDDHQHEGRMAVSEQQHKQTRAEAGSFMLPEPMWDYQEKMKGTLPSSLVLVETTCELNHPQGVLHCYLFACDQ